MRSQSLKIGEELANIMTKGLTTILGEQWLLWHYNHLCCNRDLTKSNSSQTRPTSRMRWSGPLTICNRKPTPLWLWWINGSFFMNIIRFEQIQRKGFCCISYNHSVKGMVQNFFDRTLRNCLEFHKKKSNMILD